MKLYHGSKHKFTAIKRQQATMVGGSKVPEAELQNKIYLTPDIGFAIAMASGPDGMTSLVNGEISFENQNQFDADRSVYVYIVESETLSPELLEKVDNEQYALDMDELTPAEVVEYTAKDVFNYYSLVQWKSFDERSEK